MTLKKTFLGALSLAAAFAGCTLVDNCEGPCVPEKVTQLFNGKDLDGWYVWLNGRGRDNDPQQVFKVEDGLIKVSGREYGCITTEKEYRDYHLIVEYRFTGWLDEQRTKAKAAPDTGILFHSTGADGAFYGTWMASHEYNVVEGGTGDFWTVAPKDRPDVTLTCKVNPKREHDWDPYRYDARSKETVTLTGNKRVIRGGRPKELKHPEWNVCELICDGEKVECRLNGVVVNQAERVTPTAGRIQLQSEGSGVEFRKVEIRPIKRPVSLYLDEARKIWYAHRTRLGNAKPEAVAAIDYLEGIIADADRLMLNDGEVASLWLGCAGKAQDLFLDNRFTKSLENALRLDPGCTNNEIVAARYLPRYRAMQAAKAFPLPEKELKFGQTLKSMGVVEKKTVHLKDYWNPTNVTTAFQKLVDDPEVTTIVLDATPTPWFISSVKFGPKVNGKRVLLKSGVKLMRDPAFWIDAIPKGKGCGAMLDVLGGKNIIIESDAAKPEDVLIAFYPNAEERAKHNKREGSSGIGVGAPGSRIDCSRNVVLRNFRVADTEEDGIAIGANWRPCEEVYVENVVMDSNFRQGTSPCSYYSLYFKGCKFINTHGGPPTAGVDVEPWADYLTTAVLYFLDCEFANNGGGGLLFATATRDPILCHVKRCTFKPTEGAQINICARPSGYIAADATPHSNILVEDTTFESTGETLKFEPCPIYDMTLRNCVIRDGRTAAAKARAKHGPAPVCLSLNRPFGQPDLSDGIRPTIAFENVKIEGFEDSEPLGIFDEIGMLNIRNVFTGVVDWNGKKVDFAKVEYMAPDIHEPRTAYVDLKSLQKPAKVPAAGEAMPVSDMELCYMGAWWLKNPHYSYYFWAEKGRAVSFDFTLKYPHYYSKFPTNTLSAVSASGVETKVGDVTKGTQTLTYVAPETGWHRFSPGPTLDPSEMASGINWYVTNVKGAHFAWQADTESDSFAKFFLRDKEKPYRGYFEVPAGGKTCRLRLSFGPLELYDAAGNLRGKVGSDDYRGRHVFEIKPATDKAEIWSFVSDVDPYTTRGLRFYAPLNGLWADRPEDLPCVYAEHFVPAKQAAAAKASVQFAKLDRSKLSSAQLAKLDAAIATRKAFAAKREYVGLVKHEEEKIARMRAGKMDDDLEHQIADISGHVILLKRIVKMEEIAAKETPEVLETAAFCQAFAPDVVGVKELGWPKGVLEYKDVADLVALRDLVLKRIAR